MKPKEMYEHKAAILYNEKPLYIYESHLGCLYVSEDILDINHIYCEQCGDSDWLIGRASTKNEAWDLLNPHTDMFDSSKCDNCLHKKSDTYCYEECENYLSGGEYDYNYVKEFIDNYWEE